MTGNENHDDLERLIEDGYSQRPTKSFTGSLRRKLSQELEAQGAETPETAAPAGRSTAHRLAAFAARHWRLAAEVAACAVVGLLVWASVSHHAPREDRRSGHR